MLQSSGGVGGATICGVPSERRDVLGTWLLRRCLGLVCVAPLSRGFRPRWGHENDRPGALRPAHPRTSNCFSSAALTNVSRTPLWIAAACCRFDARSLPGGGAPPCSPALIQFGSSGRQAEGALNGRAERVPASKLESLQRQLSAAVHGHGLRPCHRRVRHAAMA